MDAIQRVVIIPTAEIVIDRATCWQVLRQRRPLTVGAEDIHHPVNNCPHVHRPLVAALLR